MITMIDGALQSVDRSLYESAKLDGAGFFRTHFSITWPSVWPIIAPSVAMVSGSIVATTILDVAPIITKNSGSLVVTVAEGATFTVNGTAVASETL